MAKGDRKVTSDDDSSGGDSDDEFIAPSYDELAALLKEYTQVIRKKKAKNEK
jgi:hypothetical protein